MLKFMLVILPTFLLLSCGFTDSHDNITLEPAKGFPKWLKGTDQTSGISFMGLDKNGDKNFLLADDIGKLHRLKISNDSLLNVFDIKLGAKVNSFLAPFSKWDFEEIVLDRYSGKVYISIEGNGPLFNNYVGIYLLAFFNNDIYSDSVVDITRVDFIPSKIFFLHTAPNIGYEGFAVDENYFYLGLEGFQQGDVFADSTIIYIADKKSYKIVDSINTKTFGVSTACGLYSDNNNSLYGIDRNGRKIFHLTLNSKREVEKYYTVNIKSEIPFYHYNYTAALESIAIDNEKNLYLVDDPWKKFYIPSEEILKKMDSTSVNNFKDYLPIIYKFKIKN